MSRNFPFFENEFLKTMTQFNVPSLDVETLVSTQRKNVEAFAAANRLAVEGIQAVMRRQLEIFRQTVDDTASTIRELSQAQGPQERASKQLDLMKVAYDQALENMSELGEMLRRSNTEAAELIKNRVDDTLDELKNTVAKKGAAVSAGVVSKPADKTEQDNQKKK